MCLFVCGTFGAEVVVLVVCGGYCAGAYHPTSLFVPPLSAGRPAAPLHAVPAKSWRTGRVLLTGTITNPDGSYSHIEAEGDTYEEARGNLYALLEEG